MDELDILKKQWKKEEETLPRLKSEDIYQMILKRSSSAVKWILIISILELAIGIILPFLWHPSFEKQVPQSELTEWISWLVLPVGIYFIYRFFMNYKRVNSTSSVKDLLSNIMRSRKTVRLYIIVNLVIAGVLTMVMMISSLVDLKGGWENFQATATLPEYLILFGISLGITVFMIGIILLIYFLLYGLLMRRLNKNYKDLKKIE
ncbi:hypothetical protein [Robertkochia flava]|uniref:hypothetical protein n=1 Tax=Robertkochia flava TaxID=3447986 RepID=UPI001CD038C7|nr:hypothetical protein [Robertkochia marina]